MSWLFSAASSIGPVVGSDSTTAVISAPEITAGKRLPMSEMKKLSASRIGYLRSSLPGGRPLARPVTTYCFCSSSSRFARILRIMPAVPPVPITITGIQMCSNSDFHFAHVHGLSMNSGSIRPPIDVPNQTLARYIITSASMKLGIAMPRKPSSVSP